MFIQTEATPNPATLKFLPGETVVEEGPFDFADRSEADGRSVLAETLFNVDGVEGVFFGFDFITITKRDDLEWQHLKPAVLGVIMEHFMAKRPVMVSDRPVMEPGEEVNDEGSEDRRDDQGIARHPRAPCRGAGWW